ncbi:MAG TPA: hypothetical protein VEY69_16465 [Lautropia sp.]|jgi:hypothetical protein|nr:hypothetical protein [Lautropia sp.]
MGGSFHHYEPSDGHGLPHDPFNAIIGAPPIDYAQITAGAMFDMRRPR